MKTGCDVRIAPGAVIRHPDLASFGNHVAVDEFFVASTQLVIGNYIHIGPHVAVIGGRRSCLTMRDFSNIATGGVIVCGSDGFKGEGLVSAPGIPEAYRDTLDLSGVVFERFANIGARVTVLPGVVLPEGVVIGACSLVLKSARLKPWTIYAGNPLREIGPRKKGRVIQCAKELTGGVSR